LQQYFQIIGIYVLFENNNNNRNINKEANTMNSNTLNNGAALAGRAMLAAIFIIAGISKIGTYAGTQAYMESVGVPGMLLPAVIGLEVLGGIAILIGFQTRISATMLAGFTFAAAILFHSDFSQQMQSILFMKNVAIAGAFLMLVAQGPGQWAIESVQQPREARS
jgi:putative oxidoreductase